ncbi:amidohydrolase [Vibrio astriarenae]|uniref:Amidohydrolase n=1 Tax=Vibrio astriarenae TaxID=1481923 RepID=A0A7Z2T3Q8_9VIBR|nr:amidohydrolase [Vibrio astriarenae]QIA63716.1 amidohydrolase [Vibrio astriarenae]
MSDYQNLDNEVTAIADELWAVSSKVWELAELSYQEIESSALESALLEKHGFEIVERNIAGLETSWVATWGSGKPVIGYMVEFDALPSLGNKVTPTQQPTENGNTNGHGCGHSTIGPASIGGAIALKKHMEKEGISGTIKVFGCPAEEALNGKNYMVAAGAFDGIDVALHNHPFDVTTAVNFHTTASVDLIVEWHGVTAHAGVSPWEGRSALHASEIFLVSANMMREQLEPTARLHYQILEGGAAVNVIPDHAKVLVRYRGKSADDVRKHKAWLEDMAKGAALSTQTRAEVTNLGGIYDILPNDTFADSITQHLNRYFPVEWTEEEQNFARAIQREAGKAEDGLFSKVLAPQKGVENGGSSDVGDVSWTVPTMGIGFSAWPLHIPAHQWGVTASVGSSIGRKAIVQASHTLAAQGLELMTNPDLLEAIKKDFETQKAGREYVTLNDLDVNPAAGLTEEQRAQHEEFLKKSIDNFLPKEGR